MKVSVIISFYQKLHELLKVLAGFELQSFEDFEIIIADDGSDEIVIEKIKRYINNSKRCIKHVWHQDEGWRKNVILNKAVIASNSDYLIFIDGDCIPHEDFIEDHFKFRACGELLAGRRVRLSSKISEKITVEYIKKGSIGRRLLPRLISDGLFGKTIQVEKGIRISWLPRINKINAKSDKRQLLGCNFSIHKEDLLAINGFDERYKGPGIGEDIDIELRYRNNGGKLKFLRYCAIQYHLYHPMIPRETQKNNDEIYKENRSNGVFWTPYGIKKGHSIAP